MLTFRPETSAAVLTMPDYTLVDEPDSISADLAAAECLGVDTEFMRERTYNAELCLVQIAAGKQIYCIDPLETSATEGFWNALLDTPWVLHSGRQDVEVVFQTAGRMPRAIFDTQVAAGLLGHPPQMGYGNLVRELFDVEIPKSHTRADWSRRPLSDALLGYAAEDVEYLLPARDKLAAELEASGRLDWAIEDSALLLDKRLYSADPSVAIDRLKGARNLRGRRRTAAVRLASWREREAQRANRPRQWIVRDAALVELASKLPDSMAGLEQIDGLAQGLIRRAGEQLLDEISASANESTDYRPPASPTDAQKAGVKRLQAEVAACAGELGIAAEILASRKDLVSLVAGEPGDARVLNGWRRDVIGERLLALG